MWYWCFVFFGVCVFSIREEKCGDVKIVILW